MTTAKVEYCQTWTIKVQY